VSKKALVTEAAFWEAIRKTDPRKVCHK